MRIHDLHSRLAACGAQPCHSGRIVRAWLNGQPLDSGPRNRPAQDYFPLAVRAALAQLGEEFAALARLRSEHPGADGSARLLVELADGQMVESVLLPRDGLCVSTQVGCAVGCVFCMTGKSGLLRQLGSAEIVAQVALARRFRAVKKVVFMGMGEPAHNLDNVLEAIQLLGTEGGIGHKNLVFSTVGDPRVFERLPQERVKPALALSLHTTRAELRRELLPRAPQLDPTELVELGEAACRTQGKVALQGNLDPATLYASPEAIRAQVREALDSYAHGNGGSRDGHVFNLGHGMSPDMNPDHVTALVQAVHRHSAR